MREGSRVYTSSRNGGPTDSKEVFVRGLRKFIVLGAVAASLLVPARGALGAAGKKASPPPEESKKGKTLSDLFEGMEFRCIGPYRGGRSIAVTGVRHDRLTFYFGGTGGGVWKTADGGANWE